MSSVKTKVSGGQLQGSCRCGRSTSSMFEDRLRKCDGNMTYVFVSCDALDV